VTFLAWLAALEKILNIDNLRKYLFSYPSDVGRYNHLLLGPSVSACGPHGIPHSWRHNKCLLATIMSLCTLPHLKLGNGSDTIYNDPPQRHNIVSLGVGRYILCRWGWVVIYCVVEGESLQMVSKPLPSLKSG